MNKLISLLASTLFFMAGFVTTELVMPQSAQAQYTVGDDFKLAWSLDPRSDQTNFTRGPAFGTGRVLVDLDLDGDGKKEFLFGHDETLAPSGPDPGFLDVYLYENTGDDTYEYVWHYSHNLPSNSFPALATGDIDGDGLNEIYFGIPTINDDPNDLLIFEQDDQGVFPDTPTVTYDYGRAGSADFRPAGFQLVDVDGDGEIELLTVSRTSGARELIVSSLTTPGLDAFAFFENEFEVGDAVLQGGGVYDVMVVDFDGDGSNEIWVNTWDNWSMSVFEVTGPNTYALQADLNGVIPVSDPGSFNAHDLYFDDYDGDGKMEAYFPMTDGKLYWVDDLADVSTFNVTDIVDVGRMASRTRGADIGDLDGDGLTDIVASTGIAETVVRVEYDGVGDRADSTSYSWSTILDATGGDADRFYPLRIAEDMDGDGRNEVVITNRNGSFEGQPIIIMLEYDGPPSAYTLSDDVTWSWSLDPRSDQTNFTRGPAFGTGRVLVDLDLDGDGKKEFLFGHDETLAPSGPDPGFLDVYLYENTGDDTYEHVWHYSHNLPSNSFPALATGDIDGDGLNEIYFGIPTINDDPNDLLIFEQDDQGVFPDTPTVTYDYGRAGSADFRPAGFQLVDVDGDGEIELLTVSRTSGARELIVSSLTTPGLDAFAFFENEFEVGDAVLQGGGVYDVMVVDFDGDGSNEIWVNTWDNWSMSVFEVTGPNTYALQADLNGVIPVSDPGSFNAHDLYFDDYDGDGKMEAYFPMTDGKLYWVDDLADVSTFNVTDIVDVGRMASRTRGADIGDLDGDGLTDIVASTGIAETVVRVEYDGVGDRADSTSYSWSTILDATGGDADRFYPLRIAEDMDGDGRNEVVITTRNGSFEGQPIIIILEAAETATGVDDYAEIPDQYVLDQNYPNPFNPTTSIEFELPSASTVTVRVYNVMGQLVRTLVDGEMREAGRHGVSWDGRNTNGVQVASGTYVYALEYGNTQKARTMVLLK